MLTSNIAMRCIFAPRQPNKPTTITTNEKSEMQIRQQIKISRKVHSRQDASNRNNLHVAGAVVRRIVAIGVSRVCADVAKRHNNRTKNTIILTIVSIQRVCRRTSLGKSRDVDVVAQSHVVDRRRRLHHWGVARRRRHAAATTAFCGIDFRIGGV
jgi:hypothetical protein